jgi:glutamate--cysteine ligase
MKDPRAEDSDLKLNWPGIPCMARDVSDSTPIASRDELVAWLASGCKPASEFRLGTEHEKILFYRNDLAPVPYEGRPERNQGGVRALLEGLAESQGWNRIEDAGALIGLFDQVGGGAISLEPGGQFELSGAPLDNIHQTAQELDDHLEITNEIAARHDIGCLGLGMSPKWTLAETPVMPKSRYKIMTAYMPKVGARGLDMMYRTGTVQANLDFSSEADMVRKLRVSIALQPLATALFANSPFTEGRPNGRLSERSEIWRDTDNERAGMLPFVFEDGMGFERFVDYALNVPMYFVKRGETYHDVAGMNFRDLLRGNLAALPGETATLSDWANHLSTIFPEVRLKKYLEMRGGDVGPRDHILALPAMFVGLFYDASALDAAWDLVKGWTAEQRQALRDDVPRRALSASIAGRGLREIGREVLAISREGLRRRRRLDARGRDETMYLAPLDERIASGRTLAERWLEKYAGAWGEKVDPVFTEAAL